MAVSFLQLLPLIREFFKMKLTLSFLAFTFLAGCSYTFPEPEDEMDNFEGVDFSRFYVIGDGFSSGIMNGVLIANKQKYSYPNLIGEKINMYYGSDLFLQPDIQSTRGYNIFEEQSVGYYELYWELDQSMFPFRRTVDGELPEVWNGPVEFLKNLSVPELRSYQIDIASNQVENIFADRLPIRPEQSIADHVIQSDPAVVLLTQGIDDLKGYLLNGATGSGGNNPQTITKADFTSFNLYRDSLEDLLARLLTETESEVILATVPDPLTGPYFTSIPYHMVLGYDIAFAEIGLLNNYYSEFNTHVRNYNLSQESELKGERPFIDFDVDGGHRFRSRVIEDPTLPKVILEDNSELPKIRQMEEGEMVLYSFLNLFKENDQYGKTEPITDVHVLTENQQSYFRDILKEYNDWLRIQAAGENRVHLFDISKIIQNVADGEVLVDGVNFGVEFTREGIYSADGIFLNPRGQAILTNNLIKLINQVFNLSVQSVDVNSYPSTDFSVQ